MELTIVQKEILQELIAIYEEKNKAVKGTEIAIKLNRNPGTIRNQMQALRALNLVDGVPGPKGGYVPTGQAYRSIGLLCDKKDITVPIYKDNKPVEGVFVEKIIFDTIAHEKSCSSMIHIRGDTKLFSAGDIVKIGPTHHNKITVVGKIAGRDDINHILLIDVIGVMSVPNIPVESILHNKKEMIFLKPTATIREASKLLYSKNIHGVPIVSDETNQLLEGIITLHDIAKSLAEGLENGTVDKIMVKDVITISTKDKIFDAIEKMDKHKVGRLIAVNEDNKVEGIITRTDIMDLLNGAPLLNV
ncbi:CBS domain-containing protein [Methanococcus aeolicus]|jgi:predicted transcriptional regulator|uniref:Signal transduction protein with CBS domains n=1 Tax=Methanococcus aeolicus (strain ATCC BAA-1280 / DSM 17508 / OCM 812 / Nankai-3) TaxID=419665 RepID=A6UV15_META3|nr:CBS domain-containing protein [Methanococcus aeolicus]ABR56337.1 putative signal transduction protein with CBS domains [Methanococcus aeolicus Nankai-3]UXM84341.1 CBS domain-containing protein [Methanococcus aeolicus]